jgi:lipoyl synthase
LSISKSKYDLRGFRLNSPEFIQTSLAAAISLGLENGSFKEPVTLTGLNLLLVYDDGCIGRCSYCGISGLNQKSGSGSSSGSPKKTFIRVKWPVYNLEDVLAKLKLNESKFERICISMITHRNAVKDTISLTRKIRQVSSLPLSLLITPTLIGSKEVLEQLKDAGAEMTGIAVDGATEEIFEKYRGKGVGGPHKWEKYWQVLEWAVEVFGKYKAGIHLIIGLDETEKEAVQTIYRAHLLGAKTHLFSFYPEECTGLRDKNPPELLSYRKIQIARYLINEEGLDISKISFDADGSIDRFDYNLDLLLEDGYAFMTSGCPCRSNGKISACNRPFANERPSEVFRNYPYVPTIEDKELIKQQISQTKYRCG